MPHDFTHLKKVDSSILQEMRYAGSHNFIGRPIKGYPTGKCILTKKAAQALSQVQMELKKQGLSLKVYDCYRPQMAVDDFVAWAKDLADLKMKQEFYPRVEKKNLFKDGFIAEKSGHSRGSTIDLTIDTLDMGTSYDFFDPLAHTENSTITDAQKKNRQLLKSTMEKNGFRNLREEWWHYTLVSEPHPNRYFNFEVR